jgi:hypothetical protein
MHYEFLGLNSRSRCLKKFDELQKLGKSAISSLEEINSASSERLGISFCNAVYSCQSSGAVRIHAAAAGVRLRYGARNVVNAAST